MKINNIIIIYSLVNLLMVFFPSLARAESYYTSANEYNQRIIELRASGNYYLATKTAIEFAQHYPNDGNAYVALGILSYPENKEATIDYINKALRLGNIDLETQAVIKNLLGTCYYEKNNFTAALSILNSMNADEFNLLHNNERYQYYSTKAGCYSFIEPREYDKIILYTTKALEYENSPYMYFLRGMAYLDIDKQKAREDFAIQKYLCTTDNRFKGTFGCIFFPELY